MAEQQTTDGATPLNKWASEAAKVSKHAMDMGRSTALESLTDFAKKIAAESSKREARGQSEPLSDSASAQDKADWEIQLAALAKQAIALERSMGNASGKSTLGSFGVFYGQLPAQARAEVLNFDENIKGMGPRWDNLITSLAKRDGVELARLSAPVASPGAPGEMSPYEYKFLAQINQERLAVLNGADESKAESERIEAMIGNIGKLKASASDLEVDTSNAWRAQVFSGAFVQNRDAALSALGASFVQQVRRANIDPSSNPAIGASIVALNSMMSEGAGGRMLAAIPLDSDTPEQLAQWEQAIIPAWRRSMQKWKAGQAVLASAPVPSALEQVQSFIHDSTPAVAMRSLKGGFSDLKVELKDGLTELKSGFSDLFARQPKVDIDLSGDSAYSSGKSAGMAARKMLSGFVNAFSPAHLEARVESLVERANSATDQAEARLKESVGRGLQAGAKKMAGAKGALQAGGQKLDHAIEQVGLGLAEAASAARAGFVGKVGEAKQASFGALGSVAFKAKDALPSAESIKGDGKSLQTVMLQIAGLAGALFVGVAMAPVAGVAAAAVGGIAAGMGIGSGLAKAFDAIRNKASHAPAALEAIGQKLGAKRQAREAADKVEPTMDSGLAGAPGF
jgi:hypothetical protein